MPHSFGAPPSDTEDRGTLSPLERLADLLVEAHSIAKTIEDQPLTLHIEASLVRVAHKLARLIIT